MLLFIVSSVFAGSYPMGSPYDTESAVLVQSVNENGTVIRISVLAFEAAETVEGERSIRDVMMEIVSGCQDDDPDNLQGCIMEQGLERTASAEYRPDFRSLDHAKVTVTYYDMIAGDYVPISYCQDIYTDTSGTARVPSATGEEEINYWYVDCDISTALRGQPGRTTLFVHYEPELDSGIRKSSAPYYFNNFDATASDRFTQMLNSIIRSGMDQARTNLPCIGIFLVLGLLLSSLYFAGKSPVTLLDITTPRLPMPKGVSAGGQVLMPFGYTELKRTTRARMAAARGVLALGAGRLASRMRGDSERERLIRKIRGLRGTAADRAAGDVEEGRKVAESLVTAGRSVGLSGSDLDRLAGRLPYHYGDEEHRTVAQIIEALERRGGKDALMASTMRDYFLGQRTFQSLESLTGHGAVGKRDAFHYAVTSRLGKAFGVNRYAVLGGFVPAMYDSTIRTAKIAGRMTKGIAKEAPGMARGITRTTMEMLGGRRAVEDMEARAKTSAVAAWLTKKHPSELEIGQMYPVNDKMAHLYRTLRDETLRDEMRYVLRQLYKKFGVNFKMSEHELAQLGHKNIDILAMAGYKSSKDLTKAEKEVHRILTSTTMDAQQKLSALAEVARSHGANIDSTVFKLANEVMSIEKSDHAEHAKLLLLQEALERQSNVHMAVNTGGMVHEDAYVCHVGGDSLKGSQIWETMVLRTMIWDMENGQKHEAAGVDHYLKGAVLNVGCRSASLDPTSAMHELPEYMRNPTELKAVADRNRAYLADMFTNEGKELFAQTKGKSLSQASISEIVDFMHGGPMKRTGHIDPVTKKMVWWGSDEELAVPKGATLVDMKRHWVSGLDPQENYAIGQWVQSRFTRSYVPPSKASLEAELDRMPGSANWTVKQRTNEAKKLWVMDQLRQDMEQRFNSHFGHNTYGTTRETTKFYAGIMAGFLEKALKEKGMAANNPEMRFLKEMDTENAKHLSKLSEILQAHHKEYQAVMSKPVTYDDIAKSDKAMVMLHEGGFAYYKKNMMLSDQDRVLGGEVALWDGKQHRQFIPEDVHIKFGDRDALMREFNRVSSSQHSANRETWDNFIGAATKWAKQGGYNYEKEKVLAAVLWQYANTTHDYERFWRNSSVSVEAKRGTTPAAPSPLRFFGVEAPKFSQQVVKPFRDIGMHMGDYISKVALASGGSLHTVSYDITPVSEYYRQHSWQLSSRIMSHKGMEDMTAAEKVAYRNLAVQHYAYHQVWDYAIDRNPWRMSTSFGTHQGWGSFFHFGPSANFSVRDNLRAYLGRGEYASFMAGYGFPMNTAGKMMRPYTNMIRGLQMSMQGYASKWDSTGDALRQWNYTQPRLLEAMQSLNPFSFKWFPGKTAERIASLNKFGGSLEKHQLAGPEFQAGLRQAPQDIFLHKKGIYANARTGETNPGASYYNYRHELKLDAPMAEYMLRTQDATYMHDKKIQEAAWNNTTRRTVSAEALAIRRDQELRGFGAMQNPLMGWANPLAFVWHMPVPLYPTSATPRDIISSYVRRSKQGGGRSFGDSVSAMGQNISRGTKKMMQPHRMHMIVYCPRCSRSGFRGSRCVCGATLY
jgi:hypothetical protein